MGRFCWFNQQYIVLETNREPGSVWLEWWQLFSITPLPSHPIYQPQTCSWPELHYNFIIIKHFFLTQIHSTCRYNGHHGELVNMPRYPISHSHIYCKNHHHDNHNFLSLVNIWPGFLVPGSGEHRADITHYNIIIADWVASLFSFSVTFYLFYWSGNMFREIDVCNCLLLNILSAEDWLVW